MPYKDPDIRRVKNREANQRFRARHPEREKEQRKRYRQQNLEKARGATRKFMARWRAENREEDRLRMAKWRAENPGKDAATARKWRKNNPEKYAAVNRNRRARTKKALVERISAKHWQNVLQLFGNRCAYCFESTVLHMDHIDPLSRGGTHELSNVAPACLTCNSSKNSAILIVWMARKAQLREVLSNGN